MYRKIKTHFLRLYSLHWLRGFFFKLEIIEWFFVSLCVSMCVCVCKKLFALKETYISNRSSQKRWRRKRRRRRKKKQYLSSLYLPINFFSFSYSCFVFLSKFYCFYLLDYLLLFAWLFYHLRFCFSFFFFTCRCFGLRAQKKKHFIFFFSLIKKINKINHINKNNTNEWRRKWLLFLIRVTNSLTVLILY